MKYLNYSFNKIISNKKREREEEPNLAHTPCSRLFVLWKTLRERESYNNDDAKKNICNILIFIISRSIRRRYHNCG